MLEIPPRLIPEAPTLDNFVEALTTNDFGRYFLNSVFVATLSTILSVALASMLAFVFARYEFPGRRVLFAALLFTMMVPGLVLLIPQFVLARNLGLLNSLWGLIIVYSVLNMGLNTFLLRGFFAGDAEGDLRRGRGGRGRDRSGCSGPSRCRWPSPVSRP